MKRPALIFCIILLSSKAVLSFSPPELVPNVVDTTNTLSKNELQSLNAQIQSIRDRADIWAAILIIPSLYGEPIESAAEITFRKWQLGEKGKDNGLLFIISLNDRRARIETGYGLEGDITDAHAKRVLDQVVLPHFKSHKHFTGLFVGMRVLGYLRSKDPLFLQSTSDVELDEEALRELETEEGGVGLATNHGFSRPIMVYSAGLDGYASCSCFQSSRAS